MSAPRHLLRPRPLCSLPRAAGLRARAPFATLAKVAVSTALAMLLGTPAAFADAAPQKHPRLASAKANCATCHAELTANK